jgi:hypothetical protein
VDAIFYLVDNGSTGETEALARVSNSGFPPRSRVSDIGRGMRS